MIVSIHVPKTAGTAFQQLLSNQFGSRLLLENGDRPLAPGYLVRSLRRTAKRWAGQTEFDPSRYDCIHGHFLARRFDYLGKVRRIIWLRDPVQRVASHYHYWKRVPDMRNADCRLMIEKNMSLVQFAALPRMRNVQARFVDGCRLSDFAFIGLFENIDESLSRLSAATGIDASSLPRSNANAEKSGDKYPISDAQAQRVFGLNKRDEKLYAEALSHLGIGRSK